MTIRVRCDGCEAVMKVKDELAGAKGKCPKCKTPFVVPSADVASSKDSQKSRLPTGAVKEKTKSAAETSAAAKPKTAERSATESDESAVATMKAPLDLPLEPTPPVPELETDDFDPLSTLAGGSSAQMPAVNQTPIPEPGNKPSVAELMKEHEEKKGKRSRRKDKPKTSKAAELAQPAMTAGTAADALNRKYDQKRDESSAEEPLMTREERRQAEQKQAMIEFAKKGVPALAGVLLLAYFFLGFMLSESLPDLGYASGKVTRNGAPIVGAMVQFSPKAPPGETLQNSTTSTATTDGEGYYELMYNPENEGVLPGRHEVTITTSSGVTFTLPPDMASKEIEDGTSHEFDFNL